MKKAYEIPEIELHTIPAMHTIEIGASWPWGDMDPDETEIIS